MFTSHLQTKLIAISVAAGLLFANILPFRGAKECYLPSPSVESTSEGVSFGVLNVTQADEVEFSFRLLEWLHELF